MASILRMIIKLHIDITPPSPSSDRLPLWMSELLKSFISPSNGLHVRLFISKIIVNWPIAFEKYAKEWIQPLMKLVMEGNDFGEPMNYHVQVSLYNRLWMFCGICIDISLGSLLHHHIMDPIDFLRIKQRKQDADIQLSG
jgi:hypothetical protein